MHRPELLIVDEPTSGLDPLKQQEFHRLVIEAKAEGRTVFLSSHNLPEVERVCDRVGIIREGKLVAVENVELLKGRALHSLEIQFATPVPPEAFDGLTATSEVMVQDGLVHCTVKRSMDAVIKVAARFDVVNVISYEPSLEDIFLAYYGDGEKRAT